MYNSVHFDRCIFQYGAIQKSLITPKFLFQPTPFSTSIQGKLLISNLMVNPSLNPTNPDNYCYFASL